MRPKEPACAARELGVERVDPSAHPDSGFTDVPLHRLATETARPIGEQHSSHLLVFDAGGVTGCRDRQWATGAAWFAARQAGIAVLGRTLPQEMADR